MTTKVSAAEETQELVEALESPHINPGSSRRKGKKRNADDEIDTRSQQRRRLDAESSSSGAIPGANGLHRTASEEIMTNPNPEAEAKANKSRSEGKHDTSEEDSTTGDGLVEGELPLPDETAPLAESMLDENDKPISKNQQKKLRKQAEWEAKRGDRKMIRKEKLLAKRERKKAAREQAVSGAEGQPEPPPPQKPVHHPRVQLPVTFLIDCDFDGLMMDKERKSLASQITRSYSDTRKSAFHPHLAVCSFGGELRHRFDNILAHYKGWKNIRFLDEDFVTAAEQAKGWMSDPAQYNKLAGSFASLPSAEIPGEKSVPDLQAQGEVVYLTSESPHTLTSLKPYSTYIIGGLVDKNREKGICYRRATERGLQTAKLPIGEFMEMSSRKVLATNHVNEIMLKWLECGDWGTAFMQVIPKRKGGRLKGEGGKDDDEEAGDDDGDVEEGMDVDAMNAGSMEGSAVNGGDENVEKDDGVDGGESEKG